MSLIQNIIQFIYQFLTAPIQIGESEISISLILKIIVALIFVFLIAQYLSNWLRNRLLVRLGLGEGSREAIATIFRYFTITIGFISVPQAAGLDLRSLTFLAGGLGIGIGFGFQGLAQNFVSGLILLLEQPIKVGDYVEVDDLEGTIRKIALRSTTIVTNDEISIIVPNLNLVSNRIINWSHGNPNSRIHIPVRVAYGSDPVLVTEVLLSAARRERKILSSPTPQVWLREFGESAIHFELLVWVNKPRARLPIQSSLNYIIQNALRQHQIKIPVNQQDLWIRNPEDLKIAFSGISKEISLEKSENTTYSSDKLSLRDLLRQVTYFENFSELQLLNLIEIGYQETFLSEQFVFHEDDPGDAFHIILSGSVAIISEKTNKHIRDLYAGDFFGELALILGIPRSAGVKALEKTILFVVSRNVFQSFLSTHPRLADQIAEQLVEREQELIQRQQILRDLGIIHHEDIDKKPLIWIRRRIKTLFEI
ncbi:MAG: mechanosensitive ion channel domain-containing protein [Microcoleaceae cyanobacterium]